MEKSVKNAKNTKRKVPPVHPSLKQRPTEMEIDEEGPSEPKKKLVARRSSMEELVDDVVEESEDDYDMEDVLPTCNPMRQMTEFERNTYETVSEIVRTMMEKSSSRYKYSKEGHLILRIVFLDVVLNELQIIAEKIRQDIHSDSKTNHFWKCLDGWLEVVLQMCKSMKQIRSNFSNPSRNEEWERYLNDSKGVIEVYEKKSNLITDMIVNTTEDTCLIFEALWKVHLAILAIHKKVVECFSTHAHCVNMLSRFHDADRLMNCITKLRRVESEKNEEPQLAFEDVVYNCMRTSIDKIKEKGGEERGIREKERPSIIVDLVLKQFEKRFLIQKENPEDDNIPTNWMNELLPEIYHIEMSSGEVWEMSKIQNMIRLVLLKNVLIELGFLAEKINNRYRKALLVVSCQCSDWHVGKDIERFLKLFITSGSSAKELPEVPSFRGSFKESLCDNLIPLVITISKEWRRTAYNTIFLKYHLKNSLSKHHTELFNSLSCIVKALNGIKDTILMPINSQENEDEQSIDNAEDGLIRAISRLEEIAESIFQKDDHSLERPDKDILMDLRGRVDRLKMMMEGSDDVAINIEAENLVSLLEVEVPMILKIPICLSKYVSRIPIFLLNIVLIEVGNYVEKFQQQECESYNDITYIWQKVSFIMGLYIEGAKIAEEILRKYLNAATIHERNEVLQNSLHESFLIISAIKSYVKEVGSEMHAFWKKLSEKQRTWFNALANMHFVIYKLFEEAMPDNECNPKYFPWSKKISIILKTFRTLHKMSSTNFDQNVGVDRDPAQLLMEDIKRLMEKTEFFDRTKMKQKDYLQVKDFMMNIDIPKMRQTFFASVPWTTNCQFASIFHMTLLNIVLKDLGKIAEKISRDYMNNFSHQDKNKKMWKRVHSYLMRFIRLGKGAEKIWEECSYHFGDFNWSILLQWMDKTMTSCENHWKDVSFESLEEMEDDDHKKIISSFMRARTGIKKVLRKCLQYEVNTIPMPNLNCNQDIAHLLLSLSIIKDAAITYQEDFLSRAPLDIRIKIFQYLKREEICMLSRTSKDILKNIEHSKSIRAIKWKTPQLKITLRSDGRYAFLYAIWDQRKFLNITNHTKISNCSTPKELAEEISTFFNIHNVTTLIFENMIITSELFCELPSPSVNPKKLHFIRCSFDSISDTLRMKAIQSTIQAIHNVEELCIVNSPNMSPFVDEKVILDAKKMKELNITCNSIQLYDHRFIPTELLLTRLHLLETFRLQSMVVDTRNVFIFMKKQLLGTGETDFKFCIDRRITFNMLTQAFPQPDYECIVNTDLYPEGFANAPVTYLAEVPESYEFVSYLKITKVNTNVKRVAEIELRYRIRQNVEVLHSIALNFY